ncbi:MAG: metal-dependent hydrolase [bacterium]
MFADFGLGIIAVIISTFLFKIQPTVWMFLFSIFFCVAPDIDFICYFSKRGDKKYDHEHRNLIHYPLIYLSLGYLLFLVFFGRIWAFIFILSSFFHFAHDSIGIGWGVKWLYPFSNNNFAFFYLYSKKIKKGLRKIIFCFSDEEQKEISKMHGDSDWVNNIYYKWHIIAKIEFIIFIVAIFMLIFYLTK